MSQRVKTFYILQRVNFLTYRNHLMVWPLLLCYFLLFNMKVILIQCPKCGQPGTYLKGLSRFTPVDYYGCDNCQQVWPVPKDDPKPTTDAPMV